jgi:hypothetical protein
MGWGETLILSVMDMRRSPTTAPLTHRVNEKSSSEKIVSFKLYTGDLWVQNPDAHIWVITDGFIAISPPQKSLKGRGITIGYTNHCNGVGFELFGWNSGYPGQCLPVAFLPNDFYDFRVHTVPKSITVFVEGPGIDESISFNFEKNMPSYDTVVGVAGDTQSATYGFFNVVQTIK